MLDGRGTTTVWAADGKKRTFEWQKHSLFMLPHDCHHQFTNMQGDRPVRLLHYNYLPIALSVQDPKLYVEQAPERPHLEGEGADFYSEARIVADTDGRYTIGRTLNFWYGNFFPDMRAWDKLDALKTRGVDGDRLDSRGKGETDPIAPNRTRAGRAKNRRVEFLIAE